MLFVRDLPSVPLLSAYYRPIIIPLLARYLSLHLPPLTTALAQLFRP